MLQILEYINKTNIAEDIDKDTLAEMGQTLVARYNQDLESRVEWETRIDEYMKLAAQVVEKRNFPWRNSANIKYPLLTTAALRFSSVAYPALVPGTDIVRGRVNGFDPVGLKQEASIRVGKHMSYQLLEQMEDWTEEMDKMCMTLPIIGCMFKKTYYCPVKQKNVSELVSPRYLVVDYYAKSLEDADQISHVMELSSNDLHERMASGIYRDVELPSAEQDNEDHKKAVNEIQGTTQTRTEKKPRKVIEVHGYWDLDDDGYEEPYIFTIDVDTKQVLRVIPRFDKEAITSKKGKVVKIDPVHYFTKFSFIPNPDGGFYDIGFGTLLGPINNIINSSTNMLLDAGTLSTLQSGYLSRGIRLKGGSHRFEPGEWKTIQSSGDDLRKGIFPLPVREPSNVLFSLLQLMISSGEKLSGTTDIMMGENTIHNQKATTSMLQVEQGMKTFNGIYARLHRSLAKEFKKLFRLNGIYLENKEYFTILDPGQEKAAEISIKDYDKKSLDVTPVADPNVATEQQKLAKANALLELLPLGLNVTEVKKRVLEAQNQASPEALMQQEEQPPSPEELQFEDESKRAWAEITIKAAEVEANIIATKAGAIAKLADAESKEEGTQMAMYNRYLEALDKDADRQLKALSSVKQPAGEASAGTGGK